MQCPRCQAFVEDRTVFCGNCGQQIAPLQAIGATVYDADNEKSGQSLQQTKIALPDRIPGPPVRPIANTPPPTWSPQPRQPRQRRPLFLLLSAIVILVILAGGTILVLGVFNGNTSNQGTTSKGTLPKSSTGTLASGQVLFFDGPNGSGNTDALKISVSNLSAPPAGSHYAAWLVDEQAEHAIALGNLVSTNHAFGLNFVHNGGSAGSGNNLLGLGNVVQITLEKGNVQLPTGKVVLSATFPPKAFVHIRHLLFSFPTTPGKIGLLDGLLDQTRLLNAQSLALQSIQGNQNVPAIRCIAQSLIDISEGQRGAFYAPLAPSCGASIPLGDGFGILGANGYAKTTAVHASLAATQTDSTAIIRSHANEVEIATTNITQWVTTIDQEARNLLAHPNDTASIQKIVTLADHTYHGVDVNGDGQIASTPGEAGATTAYLRGQLTATLTLAS